MIAWPTGSLSLTEPSRDRYFSSKLRRNSVHAAPEAESPLWRQASRPVSDPPQTPLARQTSGFGQNPLTRLTSNLPQNPLSRLASEIELLPFLREPDQASGPSTLTRLTSGIRLLPLPHAQEKPPLKRLSNQSADRHKSRSEGQRQEYAPKGVAALEGVDAFKPKRSSAAPDQSIAALLPAGLGIEPEVSPPRRQGSVVITEDTIAALRPETVTEAASAGDDDSYEHVTYNARSPSERGKWSMRRIVLMVQLDDSLVYVSKQR